MNPETTYTEPDLQIMSFATTDAIGTSGVDTGTGGHFPGIGL